MMALYILIGWLLIGSSGWIYAVYDDWKRGEDITLEDVLWLPLIAITGPVFFLWMLRMVWKRDGAPVLIAGKGRMPLEMRKEL